MHKQRLTILIIAAIGAAATFLPWVSMPFVGSINGTKGDGWITFGLYIVPLILSLLKDRNAALNGTLLIVAIIPALIASGFGIYKITDFNISMSGLNDNPFASRLGAAVSIEIGLYLVAISGILLTILSFLFKNKKEEEDAREEENY
jgi:hypothetical protein